MARPLTKMDEKGALYVRPPSVEAKIDAALTQDWQTLSKRAKVTDPRAPNYLPSECLVHLIREAIRRGDHRIASVLMPFLLVRCDANLKRTVSGGEFRNAEAIREEILSSFQLLFTDDAAENALDYYECKFNRAFRSLRINHVRAEIAAHKELTDLPEATTEDGETMLEDDMLAQLSRAARIGPAQEDHAFLPQVLKVLNDLPSDQRRAVVLRRIIGHTEESAAAICGVEGRTIRNRLKRADERIKKLKENP